VVRLTRTGQDLTALLTAGSGSAASLLAARSADGSHWTLSPPLPLHGTALTSASFGPAGTAAIIAGNRGQVITGAGARWQPLPPLPAGTAALAPGPGGAADALAVHRGTLTVWHLAPRGTSWGRAQVINVPIPYGPPAKARTAPSPHATARDGARGTGISQTASSRRTSYLN